MGFFGWFFLILFGIWATFRLFGRQISRFLITQLIKKATKAAEEQARQYQQNYSQDPYHEEIQLQEDLEIQIPKNQPKSSMPDLDELAETVEFEEIREK